MGKKICNVLIFILVLAIAVVAALYVLDYDISSLFGGSKDFEISAPKVVFKDETGKITLTSKKALNYLVSYKNGYLTSDVKEYSGSNVEVLFKAIESGNEEVSVNASDINKTVNIFVCNTINLEEETIKMDIDQTMDLKFDLDSICLEQYTFKMEDEEIALYENGQIKSKKVGKTNLVITRENEKKTYQIEVVDNLVHVSSIAFDQASYTVGKNKDVTMGVTILPDDATDKTFTCTSSDTKIAEVTVSKDGCVVKGKSDGKVTITVKSGEGQTATSDVTVKDVTKVTGITLNKTSLKIEYDKEETLVATITPSNADEEIKWTSSDSKIAKVDQKGKITALQAGTATIKVASASGVKAECTVTVEPYVRDMKVYPFIYRDGTADITIERKVFNSTLTKRNTVYYVTHVILKDYGRLYTDFTSTNKEADGKYAGGLISKAADAKGAIFAAEGDYSANKKVGTVHNGVYYNYDSSVNPSTIKTTSACYAYYNKYTGVLGNCKDLKSTYISQAISSKELTDTFRFSTNLVVNGKNQFKEDATQRPRQANFVGYVKPGEFYFIVSEGLAYEDSNRSSDGYSYGLTRWEKANLLIDLGCSFGMQLDGGGSVIVWFRGKRLHSMNEIEVERNWLTDFVYIK